MKKILAIAIAMVFGLTVLGYTAEKAADPKAEKKVEKKVEKKAEKEAKKILREARNNKEQESHYTGSALSKEIELFQEVLAYHELHQWQTDDPGREKRQD